MRRNMLRRQRNRGRNDMTTSKVIFDPFAGDFLVDCMSRIVGSVGEEPVDCDAK
jgi:hypothetical protein